ncbi:hypothetical protein HOY80DRAFT_1012835 [Tuber brumale]|nr:hypothetical protein HOY80DRAFT_1012835 [Tuber brumale]
MQEYSNFIPTIVYIRHEIMHPQNPQTPIKTPIPINPSAPRRIRIPNFEFPKSPTPDTSHPGILSTQTSNRTSPQSPRSSSPLVWDQLTCNTTLTPPSISNSTPVPITPKYYPGSPPQPLSPSGIPTISEARHPPQCTPNFEEACKTIQALDLLLEEVRLLKAGTFFGNLYWSELNIFYTDFKRFLNQESDRFFTFAGGASVATDADLEGLDIVAQTIFDSWGVMKEAVLRNDPGEGLENDDTMVID